MRNKERKLEEALIQCSEELIYLISTEYTLCSRWYVMYERHKRARLCHHETYIQLENLIDYIYIYIFFNPHLKIYLLILEKDKGGKRNTDVRDQHLKAKWK